MDKQTIAQKKMNERQAMDKEVKKELDNKIHENLLKFVEAGQSVAIFLSIKDEINTRPIIEDLLTLNCKIYLPRVEGKVMNFYKVNSLTDLKRSSFGILEPKPGLAVSKDDLDVIVVPLLAFNDAKYRIGYGGGYYDKYLKDYQGLKVGLAYSFQHTKENFSEKHDVACHMIVTERGVL